VQIEGQLYGGLVLARLLILFLAENSFYQSLAAVEFLGRSSHTVTWNTFVDPLHDFDPHGIAWLNAKSALLLSAWLGSCLRCYLGKSSSAVPHQRILGITRQSRLGLGVAESEQPHHSMTKKSVRYGHLLCCKRQQNIDRKTSSKCF
jgi:hypothetical protein